MPGVAGEGDDVTDVLDPRSEHHQALETEPETGVLDGAVPPVADRVCDAGGGGGGGGVIRRRNRRRAVEVWGRRDPNTTIFFHETGNGEGEGASEKRNEAKKKTGPSDERTSISSL